jgi:hypothetical protein
MGPRVTIEKIKEEKRTTYCEMQLLIGIEVVIPVGERGKICAGSWFGERKAMQQAVKVLPKAGKLFFEHCSELCEMFWHFAKKFVMHQV